MDEIKEHEQNTKERFRNHVVNYLKSPEAQTIEYDPESGRVGYERVFCGKSYDGKVTFIVSATYHSDPTLKPKGDIGLTRRDFIEIKYLDRERKEVGRLQIIQADTGETFHVSTLDKDISDDHVQFWNEGKGLQYLPIGPKMNNQDGKRLVEILDTGEADEEYTNKALDYLNTEFAHRRIKDQN